MKKFCTLFAVTLLLLWASLAFGQTPGPNTGATSFGMTEDHDNDSINLATLVPTVTFPVISKTGAFPFGLSLISPQSCFIVPTANSPAVSCGGTNQNEAFPQMSIHSSIKMTPVYYTGGTGTCANKVFEVIGLRDEGGTYHATAVTPIAASPCGSGATVTTTDGSYIAAVINTADVVTSVTLPSGYTANFSGTNPIYAEDPFSNEISSSNASNTTTFTDTLNNSTVTVTPVNMLNTPPTSFGYTDTSGTARSVTLTAGSSVTLSPYGSGSCNTGTPNPSITPISTVSYPDGTSYSITWDQGTGGSGHTSGLIGSFTLRTGGTISYAYTFAGFGSCTVPQWNNSALTRTTPDGTFSYSTSNGVTTVKDPGKNKTVYTFVYANPGCSGIYCVTQPVIAQVDRYQNTGTVASPTYTQISTTTTCYNTNLTNCTTTAPTFPITQRDIYEYTYNGATQVQMSHDVQTFDSTYGVLLTDANTDSITSQTITKTLVYGTWNGSSCVAITNTTIHDHPCTITTKNGSTQLALETLTYNSNGAVTADANWVSSTDTLTTNYTRNSNGTAATMTLPNSQVITNTFGDCNSLLLTDSTTTVNSVVIDNKETWNCDAALVVDTTDANSNEDDYAYDSMNRISSYTDRLENVTSYAYGTPTLDHVKVTDPLNVVSYQYNDGLGRPTNSQVCQTTGCSTLDTSSKAYAWNGTNFETTTYVPCTKMALNSACTTVALTQDDNPIAGPQKSTDANSGTLTYAVNSKDFSITAGPAPSQENTKVLQTEVDGFGRVNSLCALTASGYNGRVSCGQTMGGSGTLTSSTFTYAAGSYEVDTTRGSQTHKVISDAVGRVTSTTTPEAGTTTGTYDSIPANTCGSDNASNSSGDLVESVDAAGNKICYYYDGLHRLTDVGNSNQGTTNYCKRYRYDSTANQWGNTIPTGYPSTPYIKGRMFEAVTDNCSGTTLTDKWFAYDKLGHLTDVLESTPNSSGYYHTTAAYDADGTPTSLSSSLFSTFTFGVDGEDRPLNLEYGTTWVVGTSSTTGVTYDAASRPTTVALSTSGDQDTYTYDNVGNMTDFKFTVNSTSFEGVPTWNSIGSLNKLTITDGFNSGGTQTCTYGTSTVEGYDDVGRLLDANCGSLIQHDSWTYDQYDNASRTGNPGTSWSPGYSSTTNEMTGSSYDSDGNLTYDGTNSYSWNAYEQMAGTVSGNHTISCGTSGHICLTYDAFGRVVEINNGGTYSQMLYTPLGRVAEMSGQSVSWIYMPAPGGGDFFSSGGSNYFSHPDWLGTKRLGTKLSGTRPYLFDVGYTPYGELYDTFSTGSSVNDFTGLTDDFVQGVYATPTRQLTTNSGRWPSPDPAHAGWNAYAYPTDPNTQTDRSGLNASDDKFQFPGPISQPSICSDNPQFCNGTPTPIQQPDLVFQHSTPEPSSEQSGVSTTGKDAGATMIYDLFMGGVMHANSWPDVGHRFVRNLKGGGCQDSPGQVCQGIVAPVAAEGGEWTAPTFTEIEDFSPTLADATIKYADRHEFLFGCAQTGDCAPASNGFSNYLNARGIYNQVAWINRYQTFPGDTPMRLSALNPQFAYTQFTSHAVVITEHGWVIDMSATQFDPLLPYPLIFKLVGWK